MASIPSPVPGSVAGKAVLITGSNRGIGFAAVRLFLEHGAHVALFDLNLAAAKAQLVDVAAERLVFVEGDVTNEGDVQRALDIMLKFFGKVDVAILNAGISLGVKSWLDTPVEDMDLQYGVNVKGSWLTAKYAVKAMLASPSKGKGCSLCFVASVASTYGEPGMSAYTSSKWAVRGLSLTAASEFAPYGIRANAIQPGATNTEMFQTFPPETQTLICNTNVLKRAAEPVEIANAMLFLSSDAASFISGSTLAVHAGQTPT